MDYQEIFSDVVQKARKQGVKSIGYLPEQGEECRYRGENNTRCFIGMRIPDELYSEYLEGMSIKSLGYEVLEELGIDTESVNYLNSPDIEFYEKLQQIHDSNPVEEWEDKFKTFAKTYNLEVPPIAA